MSVTGLELLRDLTEVVDSGRALDNLCNSGARPFKSEDFKVFRGNKSSTSTLTYIPNNFIFSVSAFDPKSNKISIRGSTDIEFDIVNLNINRGDGISGAGITTDTFIERVDVYFNEVNQFNLPVTEILLSKQINAELFTGEISITKKNNATIQDNLFKLGTDIQTSFYGGDKITNIIYPLSSDALPLLNISTRPLYIVDLSIDTQERLTFGLAVSADGERIDLSSLHPLSVINFHRSNEVKQSDILNILLPEKKESTALDVQAELSDVSIIVDVPDSSFNNVFNTIQQQTDGRLASITSKINIIRNNTSDLNIDIKGVLKVEDPDILNNNIISTELYTPGVYIVDPVVGNINNKQRIFTSFEGPWITTTKTLSTNKNIAVGDLKFEGSITIDNLNISNVTPSNIKGNYSHKIPMYIEDSEGFISTYYLLASAIS
jgi:hypothetical protein